MTPKQIFDSFSEMLMQDERILTAPERALISALMQHAKKAAVFDSAEIQERVTAVITSAVGETVAQRAFAVLGGSVVERILESGALSATDTAGTWNADAASKTAKYPHTVMRSPSEPDPPGAGTPMGQPSPPQSPGEPDPPGVRSPQREKPRKPGEPESPGHGPKAPQPPARPMGEPDPPGARTTTTVVSRADVAVAERPSVLPARCVLLDEFLAPQELQELTRFALEHEAEFRASEVVSPRSEGGVINYEHRRSRVLMDLAQHQDVMLERIKAVLPQVLQTLGMGEFSIAEVEAQATASNDGDFFRFHSDSGSERVASRYLTFVYFFHREPRQFEGGELRIHDARLEGNTYVSEGSYQTIVPRQNQIVFFPCELMHEIMPVKCPSRLFADSRFTLNGWLRR
jgi:Rps23 Pro-64 3,4-dihydroxylase Tpa1-like proline 4-hydroxylase